MTRKELMRRIGLGKDWRFVRFDHEEVVAQHIPRETMGDLVLRRIDCVFYRTGNYKLLGS